MWLGGMDRISHHLNGESNQPQSLATGKPAFESQCFISKHKLPERGSFFLFHCPRLYSEEKIVTVRRSIVARGVYICNVTPGPWSGFLWLLAGSSCGWSNRVCRVSHWVPPLANRGGSLGEILFILTKYSLWFKNDHILQSVVHKLLGRAPWLVQHYDWGPSDGASLNTNHPKNTIEIRTIFIALSIDAKILQHIASSHHPMKGLQE